jgi:hypothetical protein
MEDGMTPDDARLYALLTLHSFLLNQVWAQRLMADPSPLAAVEAMRERMMRMLDRSTMPSGASADDMEMIRGHILTEGERFMDGVRARIEEVSSQDRPRRPAPPAR